MARSRQSKEPEAVQPELYTIRYPKLLAYLAALGQELEAEGVVVLEVLDDDYVLHLPRRVGKHLLQYASHAASVEPEAPEDDAGLSET